MKLKITIGQTVVRATLLDTATALDFVSLLPLTLTLEDYANTEKVSSLPKRLDTTDAPAGYKPSIGDITYYAPWGNLAIFYKGFSYAQGLVPLGKIDNDVNLLKGNGSFKITIELYS